MIVEKPSKRIAIFDDDEDILAICDYVLSEDGWEVRTFVECDNVVDTVKTFNPDIIIMDNWIPSVGGIEATRQLKTSAFKQIPVIYFSANRDVKQLAEKAGAETFLAKPFDVEVLKQIVDETMAKFCGRPQE